MLVTFLHHKCASTYIWTVLHGLAAHLDIELATYCGPEDLQARGDLLVVRDADRVCVEMLPGLSRGIHVVRDPRDLAVSAYFSHRYSHVVDDWPELAEHRRRLESLPFAEGLLADMEFCATYFDDMASFPYGDERILTLMAETAMVNDLIFFRVACRWLGLDVADDVLRGLLVDFKTLSEGRSPGQEDQRHHYRRGVPGDWRNHFDAETVAYFKERWGPLVVTLGYERSSDWTSSQG